MRYVAAYLLAVLGGKSDPDESDITKILGSVGIDADATAMKKVVSELKGKSIDEVIAAGRQKMASVPSGGAVSGGGGGGAPAAATDAGKTEAKEEKKKEESEEEGSDDDMGFGLFD